MTIYCEQEDFQQRLKLSFHRLKRFLQIIAVFLSSFV